MINRLLKLYNKHHSSGRIPLEDFTTEAFVGLLENEPKLLTDFCRNFLKLKSDYFKVQSQKKYFLEKRQDCLVDIVIEGKNEICFIENKVNSTEGYEQIDRYCEILNKLSTEGYKTKIFYCTKRDEPKQETRHEFMPIYWYKISQFLKLEPPSNLKDNFLKFLKSNEMDQDLTITAIDLAAMQRLPKVMKFMLTYMERIRPIFISKFGDCWYNKNQKEVDLEQYYEHERHINGIYLLYNSANYVELLYGFQFDGSLYVQIYSSLESDYHDRIVELAKKENFNIDPLEVGTCIYLKNSLGYYLNDKQSEYKIEKWFTDTFNIFEIFINLTKQEIPWNPSCNKV